MQEAEQVQQNDNKDRHASEPEDDIAQHQRSPLARQRIGAAIARKAETRRHGVIAMLTAA